MIAVSLLISFKGGKVWDLFLETDGYTMVLHEY